jgi:hypothetical protein
VNRWNIPDGLEEKIRKRDKLCVYCHVELKDYSHAPGVQKNKATWEHIDNDDLRSVTNIVRCCGACNSSKGAKKLLEWFESEYCQKKNINEKTVLFVVRNWLRHRDKKKSRRAQQ